MCGIVGYIGKHEAAPILLEGLSRLEYRGYDSAGISVLGENGMVTHKAKGRVANLEKLLAGKDLSGHLGIAHTRWATHGIPNDVNAHPQWDCKQEIFVVHNGIIENYQALKNMLASEGHVFVSETDTEVIAHLIEKFYQDDLASAVAETLRTVVGAYGIAVISKREPHTLVAAKLGSPLVAGIGEGEYIIASDVTPMLSITKNVIYLEDGDMVVIRDGKHSITDFHQKLKARKTESIDWTMEAAEKGGYEHFMLKEINEQPESITNTLRGRLMTDEATVRLGGLESVHEKLGTIDHITILGMGTARLAGMVGEYMLEEYAGIPVEVEFASEFAYRKPVLSAHEAVIAVSQSGETADTLLALKEAKRKGALSLGIVNVTGSTIARETIAGVYNHIGPEMAVASTKAFVSQLTVFAMLSVFLARQRRMSRVTGDRIIKELQRLPSLAEKILKNVEQVKIVAEKYNRANNFFFLGRKYNFPIAMEGALKLKEIAYVHAEGYNGGEMKHGPIALIDPDFPTLVIAPRDSVYEKNLSNIQEIKVRGGKVIAIATEGDAEIAKIADDVIYIPKTLEMLTPILSVIPLQLFAYYVAVARGADVDKPRNLAKSVTVE